MIGFGVQAAPIAIQLENEPIKTNVLAYLTHQNYQCESVGIAISQQHKQLIKTVKQAIQPFGYFNPSIDIKTPDTGLCDQITVSINLGEPTLITQSEIRLIDNEHEGFMSLINASQLQSGDILKQPNYTRLKSQLLILANELFYLDAQFTKQSLDVYPTENEGHVTLVFDPGERYTLGEIRTVTDQPFLQSQLIQGMLNLRTGQSVTQKDLFKSKQKLKSLGYFEEVSFTINESQKFDGRVPLTIQLSPAAKYEYTLGLGFSTDAGVKASAKYDNFRINDRGHQFNTRIQLSELKNEFGASYKIPDRQQPTNQWFNLQLAYRDQQTDNVDSQSTKWGISQTRIKANQWQNINFIDVLYEEFDTGVLAGDSLLVVPGVSWSLTEADDLARPMRGYQLQAELKGAAEDLLSDASFLQLTFRSKFIHGFGQSNRMLYRVQLGSTVSSDFDELPTTYRFFAGGDQSIRGYEFEQIAPLNEAGDVAGAKHLAVASVEFEHQFKPDWAWAAFTDFGDAFDDQFDFKQSVGTGLRWFSPIGPVRLDLGFPLDDDDNDFRLHVTIGSDL